MIRHIQLRRVALVRKAPWRPKRKPAESPTIDGVPVTMGELREFVLERDGVCLAYQAELEENARTLRPVTHVCIDKWGVPHGPYALGILTLEHVPTVHGPTDVRRDNERHCVALCYGTNVGAPSKGLRADLRTWLVERYPACERAAEAA